MRSIDLSTDNHKAAIESFLFSLRMIDGDEKVTGFSPNGSDTYSIQLERQEEYN